MKIQDKVQDIIKTCKEDVEINGIMFNQHNTIKRINRYINNQYYERDNNAIFWQISNPRITHFAKNLEFDTKDLMPYGIGEANFMQSWALRKLVRKWFDDNQFYQTLNDLFEGCATYGSMVWKKRKENGKVELEECNLANLYFDPRAKSINDTDVVELHQLSEYDILEKEEVWNNVDKLVDQFKKDEKFVEVWEFYGYDGKQKKHIIGFGFGDDYVELWSEDVSESHTLYYDFHIGRYSGRWMRIGVVERLFNIQERANQLVNQNAASTEIASLLLFKK